MPAGARPCAGNGPVRLGRPPQPRSRPPQPEPNSGAVTATVAAERPGPGLGSPINFPLSHPRAAPWPEKRKAGDVVPKVDVPHDARGMMIGARNPLKADHGNDGTAGPEEAVSLERA